MPKTPRPLSGKDLRLILEKTGVDIYKYAIDSMEGGTGKMIPTGDMISAICEQVCGVEWEDMPYFEAMQLASGVLGMTFNGEAEKKSESSTDGSTEIPKPE